MVLAVTETWQASKSTAGWSASYTAGPLSKVPEGFTPEFIASVYARLAVLSQRETFLQRWDWGRAMDAGLIYRRNAC